MQGKEYVDYVPFVLYQCVHKKGVVLRPTAGSGTLHDASGPEGTLVPPPAAKGVYGFASKFASKGAKLAVTVIEEAEIVPCTSPGCLCSQSVTSLI